MNWGDFWDWLGIYYTNGEHGAIFWQNGDPYSLIKIVNCDVTDDDSTNDLMTEFFMDNSKQQIEGLVRIYSIVETELMEAMHNKIQLQIQQGGEDWITIGKNVLDLEVGDKIGMWLMEKAAYVGLNHPDLTKREMLYRVANAAYNISTWTGDGMGDLKESNYGFREDGSAFIFDFRFDARHKDYTVKDYENYLNAVIAEK